MAGSRPASRKRRFSRFLSVRILNPIAKPLAERGFLGTTVGVLETTGRKSGQPRRTPVGNGLRGDTFWIVTEHGWHADYVKNIAANPNVRLKIGRTWRSGVATILEDDDPVARLRWLRRPVNDSMLLANATELLVIRVDLVSQVTTS